MTPRWRNPVHALPFDAPIEEALAAEYREQPLGRRVQALRKAAFRELGLVASGQKRLQCARVPHGVRTLLWVYTWTTVGDAIMDLSARSLVPSPIAIDLLIAPALAPLFARDRRFRAVCTRVGECGNDVDFVLVDSLRTSSLRLKSREFSSLPFATMRGHHTGERFDRVAFADRRLRQLFDLPPGDVAEPMLDLGAGGVGRGQDGECRIAVALGARVERKRYPHWNEVLGRLAAAWPAAVLPPRFLLMGQGESARRDLATIDRGWIERHGQVAVDRGDLRRAALDIAGCDAFLGVDGGLMHVAVAVGTPGLALFTRISPAYFLRPHGRMQAVHTDEELAALAPARVASAFFDALPGFVAPGFRRGG